MIIFAGIEASIVLLLESMCEMSTNYVCILIFGVCTLLVIVFSIINCLDIGEGIPAGFLKRWGREWLQ